MTCAVLKASFFDSLRRYAVAGLAASLSAATLFIAPVFLSPAFAARVLTPESAEIQAVQYPGWVERDGRRQPLAPGAKLRPGEKVVSGANARVLLGLGDGSTIKLGERSEFTIDHLKRDKSTGSPTLEAGLTLLTGTFRYATGVIGKLVGTRKIDLKLTTATIGIRGTDYWAMTDSVHDAACLFEGKVDVATRDQGVVELEQPTAFWRRVFAKPAEPVGNATSAELAKFISSVELTPGSGVAVVGGRWQLVLATATVEEARAIAALLAERGYAAQLASKAPGVSISSLASRADAESLLPRLSDLPGVTGQTIIAR